MQVVSLGYKSVAHYLIATQRASPSGSADSNKVAATKPEASSESEVTDKAPAAKEDLEDAEMSGQAIQKVEADHQVNNPPDDSDNDDSTSETVVTSDSQDCQVNLDIGCATPSKPTGPKKRKWIERSPDCVPTNHEQPDLMGMTVSLRAGAQCFRWSLPFATTDRITGMCV